MTTVAQFTIDYVQFLNHESKIVQTLPEFAKDLSQLKAMYRSMVLTRILDAKAVNLQRMGKMGTYPSSLGQEAYAIGMGYALQPDDIFCPYYRDQGCMLQRGVKASEILAFWGGDERASNYANQKIHEDFPIAIPVASQTLHAAGIAYALKIRKQKRAVLTSIGEGGTSKGDFYEAMNFAGAQHLPVVFVINNNQWAISVPRSLQSGAKTLAQKAIAAGFPGIQVDGNDVIAVRHVIEQALTKAHQGEGPTLVEAVTYRLCDHTTADDAKRYADKAELEKAWQYEPIARLRNYLQEQNAWSDQDEQQLQQACTAEIDQAIQEYLQLPPPPPTEIFDYMYAQLPKPLAAQREEFVQITQMQ
ncbi:MAG: pyruvate dehydrogenase (acetyl-transferring) E1 component subunit alpha [Gammaproteobacteria bacterium]